MRRFLTAVTLAAVATIATRAAEQPVTLIHSHNLTVIGRQPAKALRAVALQLEQFRAVVGGLIANAARPLPQPTFVYLFGTRREFEPFVPLYDGRPGSIGGYFIHDEEVNDIALQLEGYDESARVVLHEYTHLLLHNAARFIPLWLDEGVAEYYSTYALEPDGRRAHIGRPVAWHVLMLRDRFLPLADLIAVDRRSPMYNERDRQSIFYAEAWALTHYLMTAAPDGPSSINRYATAIAGGARPDEAFQQAFGKAPAAFERDLRAYIHGVAFNSRIFTFKNKLEVDLPDEHRVLPEAEASAWLGDLQRRAGRTREAEARIEAAAAAAPDAAMPQLAKAWLRLDQRKPDEAWPAFDRAAALAPDDFSTQFTYGVALLRREAGQERFGGNTPDVERARVALTRAVAANPASSDAFAWLAYAEMLTDGRVEDAAAAIRRAIELAPGRLDYLLRYADIFVLAHSIAEARTILTDVARATIDPQAAEGARRRLEALDAHEVRIRKSETETVTLELDVEQPREPETAARPRLRPLQRGEERAYGDLVELECSASQVRTHLRVGNRVIVATARRLEDITLTAFVPPGDLTVACGTREPADAVYLTWRSAPHRTDGVATVVGTAVAIEFVPRGYTP